jgi:predicted nucleic acid-binding protein
MEKIFVDTGGWYAAATRRDHDHEAAKQFLSGNSLPLLQGKRMTFTALPISCRGTHCPIWL